MRAHGFHPDHLRPHVIPDMPAGPAIEHSPLGIFVMNGPGIKKDAALFGVSVLDATPTLLTLFGLPIGQDMDGRVVSGAFETVPTVERIASWEEALEQLVALGYIEKPGENAADYVEHTVRELRYNLMEADQDSSRHPEALEIARDLCRRDPDEQRYATKRFVSCQALGLTGEMRDIVDDLAGRRRVLFEQAVEQMRHFRELVWQRIKESGETDQKQVEKRIALELHPQAHPDPDEPFTPVLSAQERKQMVKWRNLRRYQPTVVDYLQVQVLTAEKRWDEALAALQQVGGASISRPGLLLHAAELFRHLNRVEDAERTYRRALEIDPENVQANLGLCRLALGRKAYAEAAELGRQAVAKLYFFPMAHFLVAVARVGLGDYQGAAAEFRTALAQNPHFPQAHLWLGRLLRNRFNDLVGAHEHFALYRDMREFRRARRQANPQPIVEEAGAVGPASIATGLDDNQSAELGLLGGEVLVVSGLPRSGTSMLMQMLEAGGMPILSDGRRQADENNPRGYLEFESAKQLQTYLSWMNQARGKAVKIVAPLVCQLPVGQRYRVILMLRAYDEILESQAKMIVRNRAGIEDSPQRRQRLRTEYDRIIQTNAKGAAGPKRCAVAGAEIRRHRARSVAGRQPDQSVSGSRARRGPSCRGSLPFAASPSRNEPGRRLIQTVAFANLLKINSDYSIDPGPVIPANRTAVRSVWFMTKAGGWGVR